MSRVIEVKLAKDVVLPVLALVREQAATLRIGLELNGCPLTQGSLADIPQLLGLFDGNFAETATIRIDASVAPPLVRACTLLRLYLRSGKLSAFSDKTLERWPNPEPEYTADSEAVAAYVFLVSVQELTLQHLGDTLADSTPTVRGRWTGRLRALFGAGPRRTVRDEKTAAAAPKGKAWAVVVLDDPVNTMTYVTVVFRRALGLTDELARRRMQEVHELKRSTVWEGPKREAEMRMRELRSWHLHALVEEKTYASKETTEPSRGNLRENAEARPSRATVFSRLFRSAPKPLDNVTPRAQRLLIVARKQADRRRHSHVGVEHLALALLELREGVAHSVLLHLKIDLDALQKALDETVEHGTAGDILPSIPYTQNFKEVLDSGSAEAVKLDHDYLGTEHILLGILRRDSSLASTLLKAQGLNLESVRQAVREVLKCGGAEEPRRLADKP